MIWPFSRKKSPNLPQRLVFKSGEAFFAYQCEFGQTTIRPKQGIIALVLDATKEFGAKNSVKREPDGTQVVALKVASDDGGFLVIAQTASGRGDSLKPDDVVIWVPLEHSKELVPDKTDDRFGWVGFVVAKVKPEFDLSNHNFEISSRYD